MLKALVPFASAVNTYSSASWLIVFARIYRINVATDPRLNVILGIIRCFIVSVTDSLPTVCMPPDGRIPSSAVNKMINSIPNQKDGIDIPMYDKKLIRLSTIPFFLYPAQRPNGIAINNDSINEHPINKIVVGNLRANCGATDDLFDSDTPRSPCSAFPIHPAYCSGKD